MSSTSLDRERRTGVLWALSAALLVAGFAVPWKLASTVGDDATNTLCLLSTAAILSTTLSLGQTYRESGALPRISGFDVRFAAGAALLTLAGNLASAAAIRELTSAVLTVVLRGEVVLAALIAWPVIGERVDRRYWIGATIAVAGLIVQQPPGAWEGFAGSGLAWALFASLSFSSLAVLTRKYIHRIDAVAANGLRLWLSIGFWFVVYGWPAELAAISPQQVAYCAMAAICGPFAGRLCMMIASRHLEIRFVTLCLLLSPILTLGLAWVVMNELPSSRALVGGAIMLIGISVPVVGVLRGLSFREGGASSSD